MQAFLASFPNLFPIHKQLSYGAGILAILIYVVHRLRHGKAMKEEHFARVVSLFIFGAAITDALFFVYCGFRPNFLSLLDEYPFALMVGAISVIYHSSMQLAKNFADE